MYPLLVSSGHREDALGAEEVRTPLLAGVGGIGVRGAGGRGTGVNGTGTNDMQM